MTDINESTVADTGQLNEGQHESTVAEAASSPQVTSQSWINADGTFKDGWQDSLVPDEFKGRRVYGAFKDVAGAMRHIGHQDIAISKQGKGIFIPDENSTDIERDEFYRALGRPDKPEDYKINIEGLDESVAAEARPVFHKIGLTQPQVDALIAFDKQRAEAAEKALEEDPEKYYEELLDKVKPIQAKRSEEELRKRWGDAYDARLHLANRAIHENTKEGEDRQALLDRVGNDPVVADFLATIMNKHFTDGSGVNTATGSPGPSGNVDERIDEIMRHPAYMDGRTNPTLHKKLVEDVQRLYKMKNPGNMPEKTP